MKKIITLLLAFAMTLSLTACASSSDDLMENVQPNGILKPTCAELKLDTPADFGLRLFRESFDSQKNTLISPLSVLCALAMTANGAKGETLAQMEQVLGLDVQNLNDWISSYMATLKNSENSKLSLANSIWFKDSESFTVNQDFLQRNADYYGAGLFKAPFDDSTKNDINRWVEETTDGMIKDILDEIPEEAVMYLVNALAFDAQWQKIYEENQIREGKFTTENGVDITVDMMYSSEGVYLEDDCATGFIKYYEGRDYAFVALLPSEGVSVEEYLDSLTGEGLISLLENAYDATVHTALPKFELEYDVEMSEILAGMGMTDAFDCGLADFSGIGTSAEGNIYIDRVLHKTYICVDGKGTRAGAATAVEMVAESAAEPDSYAVYLDRPFVYLLIDTQSKLPFFIGTMMDPSGEFRHHAEVMMDPVMQMEKPPELTVTCEDAVIKLNSGNYQWENHLVLDDPVMVIACGSHPLDEIPASEFQSVSGDTVTLSFPVAPDEIMITRWPGSDMGSPVAEGETVALNGMTFSLEQGQWAYKIDAAWNQNSWGGSASYHLYISR